MSYLLTSEPVMFAFKVAALLGMIIVVVFAVIAILRTIAKEKSGEYGWSWDFIFIPKGQTKTMANFKDEDRWKLWNNDGYLKLAKYLEK